MPKANELYEKVQEIRSKADELIKLHSIARLYQTTDSLLTEIAMIKGDVARQQASLKTYEYDLSKVDEQHPNKEMQIANIKSAISSAEEMISSSLRRMEKATASIEKEDARIKQAIAKIENGEDLPSPISKQQLVNELLNKLTYVS